MSQMDLTLIVLSVLNVLLMALIIFSRRQQYKEKTNMLREINEIKQDFNALCVGAGGIGEHLNRVDRQMKRLNERQNQTDFQDPLHRSYDQAIKLVQRGAETDEIMTACGLARAEVELLMMLHGNKQAPHLSSLHSAA